MWGPYDSCTDVVQASVIPATYLTKNKCAVMSSRKELIACCDHKNGTDKDSYRMFAGKEPTGTENRMVTRI